MSAAERGILGRALSAALTAVLCTASVGFGDTYVVSPLSNGLNGRARDISPSGAVCGVDAGHAFVWRPTTPNAMTGSEFLLPSLIPNFSSDAYGVNSDGLVVGHTGDDPLSQHEVPVIWLPNGSITKLHLFNGVTSGGLASGISESGQITGRNGLFTFDVASVRWNADGTGSYLGSPPGSAGSFGWRINGNGAIAGTAERSDGTSNAFVHANGRFTFIPTLPGATLTAAYDINDSGHVVGTNTAAGATAFFYDGSSTRGLANVPGDLIQVSTALGLNNRDQIVGYAHPTPNITGAVIWDSPGSRPRYLSGLIDPSSPGYVSAANPGWLVTEAVAINDFGQIAARGLSTSGGSYRALLLTPVHSAAAVEAGARALLTLDVAPNPTRGEVGAQFEVPTAGRARLRVVDLGGRTVATLYDALAGSGTTRVRWDGRASNGSRLPPAVYFLCLEVPTGVASRRLVLVR